MYKFQQVILFFIFSLAWNVGASSQEVDSCALRIGTNLSAPTDYGSEWPWADIMKGSRTWTVQNAYWVDGGANDWDTGLIDSIPLDESGYALELPAIIEGTEAPQILSLVWANTQNLPSGIYTMLYEGEGKIDFWGDAYPQDRSPGRITFELKAGDLGIFLIKLLESKKGNHIRNIRVLMPGTEKTHQQNPWSASWLEKLEPFQTFRFMDWGQTNNSPLAHWEDRAHVGDYTYSTDKGVPYEWMIRLCNRQEADAWVCIPHQADDNFIRQMARLFRDSLDPGRKIYVEYSNEIWNWIFQQATWVDTHGDQSLPWPEKYVPIIQHALDVWSEEFEGQMERTVRVVGVFEAWQDVSNRVVYNMRPGSFDAFAPAAYFGFTDATIEQLAQLGASATGEDVLRLAREGLEQEYVPFIKAQSKEIAQKLNIPMLFYEGGQHLTPNPFGTDQPYGPALVEAQRMEGMRTLYNIWLDSIRQAIPKGMTSLFMNFSFIAPVSEKYGCWGALEHQFNQSPPYDDAPKYRALLDNIYDCQEDVETATKTPEAAESFQLSPNPSSGTVQCTSEQIMTSLTCTTPRGVEILHKQFSDGSTTYRLQGLTPGLYIIRVRYMQGGGAARTCVVY